MYSAPAMRYTSGIIGKMNDKVRGFGPSPYSHYKPFMKKYRYLFAEIVIAIAVLLTMDFNSLATIDYMIIFFMIVTLVFTYLNRRK